MSTPIARSVAHMLQPSTIQHTTDASQPLAKQPRGDLMLDHRLIVRLDSSVASLAILQPVSRRTSRRVIGGIVGSPTIDAVMTAAIVSRESCCSTNGEITAASTAPTDISVSVSSSTLATPSRIEITRGLHQPDANHQHERLAGHVLAQVAEEIGMQRVEPLHRLPQRREHPPPEPPHRHPGDRRTAHRPRSSQPTSISHGCSRACRARRAPSPALPRKPAPRPPISK